MHHNYTLHILFCDSSRLICKNQKSSTLNILNARTLKFHTLFLDFMSMHLWYKTRKIFLNSSEIGNYIHGILYLH